MLENPSVDSSAAAVNMATVKRYAPPNQRNRLLGRRKSVGEPASTYANDGERNHISCTKANSMVDHGYAGVNKRPGEIHCSRLIPLHGCSDSEAFQLLNNRWTAVLSAYNNLGEDSVANSFEWFAEGFLKRTPTGNEQCKFWSMTNTKTTEDLLWLFLLDSGAFEP
ncbi:uncharacterized protein [Primulina huaijiensis]|uniref:uncharacterized protein isoform X3 n=1 Tax=Primulina huaijiensis TaxID=1492673 RepID=UPI003CC792A2